MDPDVDGGAQAQGQLAALRSRLARAEDDGRRASERSAALTELVHALSGADDPQAAAAMVATAIPGRWTPSPLPCGCGTPARARCAPWPPQASSRRCTTCCSPR